MSNKTRKILLIALIILTIYLLLSSVYICVHVHCYITTLSHINGPYSVGDGFIESRNIIRVIMGLPPTYTTDVGVPPIYLISAGIRLCLAALCIWFAKSKLIKNDISTSNSNGEMPK